MSPKYPVVRAEEDLKKLEGVNLIFVKVNTIFNTSITTMQIQLGHGQSWLVARNAHCKKGGSLAKLVLQQLEVNLCQIKILGKLSFFSFLSSFKPSSEQFCGNFSYVTFYQVWKFSFLFVMFTSLFNNTAFKWVKDALEC